MVDDDKGYRKLAETYLEKLEYSVLTVESAHLALEAVKNSRPDLIVSDFNMPGMDGVQFYFEIAKYHSHIPFVIVSGNPNEVFSRLCGSGPEILGKPHSFQEFGLLVKRMLNREKEKV